jgi:hypothetical protein
MKLTKIRLFFIIFLLMSFLAGIYVILNPESITETFYSQIHENMTNGTSDDPNITDPFNDPNITDPFNDPNITDLFNDRNVVNVVEDPPYSSTEFNEFDPYGQHVGVYTKIDVLHDSTKVNTNNGFSDNAMDTNWGGIELTNQSISSGKYDNNNIYKPMLFQPRTAFIPINPSLGVPKDVY